MKLNGPQNDRDQHWSRRRDNSRDDLINAESNVRINLLKLLICIKLLLW